MIAAALLCAWRTQTHWQPKRPFSLGNAAGGLVTANLAHAMEPFVTSVAIGKDCIPRMSLKNLSRFMEGEHE